MIQTTECYNVHSKKGQNKNQFRPMVLLLFCFIYAKKIQAFVTNNNIRPTIHKSTLFANDQPLQDITLGFLGCGTIASAIATGIATSEVPIQSIRVTKRSEEKSTALHRSFPEFVTVCNEAQDVVDRSDIVFVCVLPQQMSEVVSGLDFDGGRHTLVSLVSTSTLEELTAASGLPEKNVFRMICLPAVARQNGICLITPKLNHHPLLQHLLQTLGGYLECGNEAAMKTMVSSTGLMGPLYGILKQNRDWLLRKGIRGSDANYFLARLYSGMIDDAERFCEEPGRFDDLIEEQTPGGLNEQALKNLDKLGVYDAYDVAMDALFSRLEGKSDGSIGPSAAPSSPKEG